MRRLWITRRKATAACLAKMKVYIEDPEGDTLINGFPCRKLGDLKNGQKVSFSIGEEAARVFVVADTLSRNLYNEFVEIPAGEEDVVLTGRNVLRPFSGNPFHFDNVSSETVLENRKKVSRRGTKTMVVAIAAGVLAGVCFGIAAVSSALSDLPVTVEDKTFAVGEMQITLTEAFEETEVEGYTACYSAGDTAVFVLREDMEQMKPYGNLSLDAYGAMILANNGFDQGVQLQEEEGLVTFDCLLLTPVSGEEYYYYCGLFQSRDAYWMVQITTTADNPEDMVPQFRQWLMSVQFAE